MHSLPDPIKRETPAEIVAHIDRLMCEAEAMLAGPVSGHAVTHLTDLKFRLAEMHERVTELYGTAHRKVVEGARAIDDAIHDHPYESLLIALGAGVFIGKMISGRGRDD